MPTRRRPPAFLATTAIALALAACGDADEPEGANAKRYSGEEKQVAVVVDELQQASRDGDAEEICEELFTDKLAGVISVRASGAPCEQTVRKQQVRKDAAISVIALGVTGSAATADVKEQTGNRTTLKFVKQGGDWRIDSIAATRRRPQN